MKTTLVLAALAFGALVTLAPAQQMSYQGRITDNTGAPVPGNQSTLEFRIFDAPTGGNQVWGPFALNADLIDSRFSVKLGDLNGNDGNGNILAEELGGARYIQVAIAGQNPLPRQEILATPTSLSSTNLANSNGIVAIAEDSLLHAPEKVLIGAGSDAPSALNIKMSPSSSLVDPDGAIRIIEDDNSTAWRMFYNTVTDSLDFRHSAQSGSSLLISQTGASSFPQGLDVGGALDVDGFTNLDGFSSVGNGSVTGTLSVSSTLDANGALDVDGFSNLDGFTSEGSGRVNGVFNVNNPGGSNITMLLQEEPGDASLSFSFPLLVRDAAGANLFGYQRGLSEGLAVFRGTAFKPGGGAWGSLSDRRVKENIEELQGSLERLEKLNPVTFSYLEENKFGVTGTQIGFIAQEVETIFPQWVGESLNPLYNPEDSDSKQPKFAKNISISGFEALATAAIQELRAEKDAQLEELRSSTSQTLVSLEKENAALKTRLAELEQQFGTLAKTVETLQAPVEENAAGEAKAVSLVK